MGCPGSHIAGLVLVTVGSTKFDALIQAVDNLDVLNALVSKGYTRLVIQQGDGAYQLQNILPSPSSQIHVRCVSTGSYGPLCGIGASGTEAGTCRWPESQPVHGHGEARHIPTRN